MPEPATIEEFVYRPRRQLREIVRQLRAKRIELDETKIFLPAPADHPAAVRQELHNLIHELNLNGVTINEPQIFPAHD